MAEVEWFARADADGTFIVMDTDGNLVGSNFTESEAHKIVAADAMLEELERLRDVVCEEDIESIDRIVARARGTEADDGRVAASAEPTGRRPGAVRGVANRQRADTSGDQRRASQPPRWLL